MVKPLIAIAGCLSLALTPMAAGAWEPGDDWQDSQCRTTRDKAGDNVEVCQAIYDGNKVYLGAYWDDGSEVVGPCSAADPQPIEYKGMTKAEARTWVKSYCP
jgi:hypothetical protein